MNLTSDTINSESRRDGIKFITQSVINVLSEKRECTYQEIVNSISTSNNNTKIRRIYDVLNVLRAVKVITKDKKLYRINDSREIIQQKKQKRDKLQQMKISLEFIIKRNLKRKDCQSNEKLFLPFMIIYTDKQTEIHCNTNDDRSYYNIRSNKQIFTMKDLTVLTKMRKMFDKINCIEYNKNKIECFSRIIDYHFIIENIYYYLMLIFLNTFVS